VVQESSEQEVSVRTGPINDADQEAIQDALGAAAGRGLVSDALIGPDVATTPRCRLSATVTIG
jgi:SecD/SecF fusion protein